MKITAGDRSLGPASRRHLPTQSADFHIASLPHAPLGVPYRARVDDQLQILKLEAYSRIKSRNLPFRDSGGCTPDSKVTKACFDLSDDDDGFCGTSCFTCVRVGLNL